MTEPSQVIEESPVERAKRITATVGQGFIGPERCVSFGDYLAWAKVYASCHNPGLYRSTPITPQTVREAFCRDCLPEYREEMVEEGRCVRALKEQAEEKLLRSDLPRREVAKRLGLSMKSYHRRLNRLKEHDRFSA